MLLWNRSHFSNIPALWKAFANAQNPGNDPYCFVDLADHQSAAATLLAMNKRQQNVAKNSLTVNLDPDSSLRPTVVQSHILPTTATAVMPWTSSGTEGGGGMNFRALAELRDPSRPHEALLWVMLSSHLCPQLIIKDYDFLMDVTAFFYFVEFCFVEEGFGHLEEKKNSFRARKRDLLYKERGHDFID
ncbi:hypothetical protein CDAR_509881 [Caerostris darwini]|uniref:Uncharacterized protein n=1 Tax=Caerostris darwini TaxID=1538125 RepID=A0AAV4TSL7_9ARAC|nr:hypothetical protein CDAR_509881 [Caerostris darwini]